MLGSSTAAGAGPSSIDSAWVNKYRKSLQQINPNNQVINLAVGGFTTYKIMPDSFATPPNRPQVSFQKNIDKALSYNPDAIIVNLPSNDKGWPKQEQLANFDTLFSYSNSFGVPMFICTTQPIVSIGFAAYQHDVADSILNKYGTFAIDIFYPLADTNFTVKPAFAADAVHLNNQGHSIIHNQVMQKDILSKVYKIPNGTDLSILSLSNSSPNCTDSSAQISVHVVNLGDTLLAGNLIDLSVNGTLYNLYSTQTLSPCQIDTLYATVSTSKDTTYNLTAFVAVPNDSNSTNDSLTQQYTLKQSPVVLAVADTHCLGEPVNFSAQLIKGDTLLYYASLSDTIPLDSIPAFNLYNDTSIFVQGVSGELKYVNRLVTKETANINFNGNMFNLLPSIDIRLKSIEIRSNSTGFIPITIYYKQGSYKGFEQNSSSWTLWVQDTIFVQNSGDWVTINIQDSLFANDTLGIYIHMTNIGNSLKYQSVGQTETHSTSELTYISGSGIAYSFGNTYFPRVINAKFNYDFGTNYLGNCATPRLLATAIISKEILSIGSDKTVPHEGDTLFASSHFNNFYWVHLETGDTVSKTNYAFIDSTFILQNPFNNIATLVCFGQDKWGCSKTDTAKITIDGFVGLQEQEKLTYSIYPNPAKSEINIENRNRKTLSILIYNEIGALVIVKNSRDEIIKITVEQMPYGYYTVLIKTEQTSVAQKFIIQ